MDYKQIAHDLAIAKLYGTKLSSEDMIKQYYQFYEELLDELTPKGKTSKPAKIMRSPI